MTVKTVWSRIERHICRWKTTILRFLQTDRPTPHLRCGNHRGYQFTSTRYCVPRSTILYSLPYMNYVYRERLTKRYFPLVGVKGKRRLPLTVFLHVFDASSDSQRFLWDWSLEKHIVYSRTGNRKNFHVAPVHQSKENAVDKIFFASRRATDRIARGKCSSCAVRQHLS